MLQQKGGLNEGNGKVGKSDPSGSEMFYIMDGEGDFVATFWITTSKFK